MFFGYSSSDKLYFIMVDLQYLHKQDYVIKKKINMKKELILNCIKFT